MPKIKVVNNQRCESRENFPILVRTLENSVHGSSICNINSFWLLSHFMSEAILNTGFGPLFSLIFASETIFRAAVVTDLFPMESKFFDWKRLLKQSTILRHMQITENKVASIRICEEGQYCMMVRIQKAHMKCSITNQSSGRR